MVNSFNRFPYTSINPALGEAGFSPILPICLYHQENSITLTGLLDTGASVNVMPYDLGVSLGYEWELQTISLSLTGNLSHYEARVVITDAVIGQFEPVRLVFAWTQAKNIPLILGQVNFFIEFDICFYRSQLFFDINRKSH